MFAQVCPVQGYREVRGFTRELVAPLTAEDCVVRSMPDASPAKWHLAHTTWFFETFVLKSAGVDYRAFDPSYRALFNSYYTEVFDRGVSWHGVVGGRRPSPGVDGPS